MSKTEIRDDGGGVGPAHFGVGWVVFLFFHAEETDTTDLNHRTFKLIERVFIDNTKILKKAFVLLAVILCTIVLFQSATFLINLLNELLPVTKRVTGVFSDLQQQLISTESARDKAWATAIEIIKMSPLFGIGINHYINISKEYFGINVIAHNTYLQLLAEWGIPLAILFFSFVFYLLFSFVFKYRNNFTTILHKDIILIFLIASISISLNNARFFWLILGSMCLIYYEKKKSVITKKVEVSYE